jgi:hypothetical protein
MNVHSHQVKHELDGIENKIKDMGDSRNHIGSKTNPSKNGTFVEECQPKFLANEIQKHEQNDLSNEMHKLSNDDPSLIEQVSHLNPLQC